MDREHKASDHYAKDPLYGVDYSEFSDDAENRARITSEIAQYRRDLQNPTISAIGTNALNQHISDLEGELARLQPIESDQINPSKLTSDDSAPATGFRPGQSSSSRSFSPRKHRRWPGSSKSQSQSKSQSSSSTKFTPTPGGFPSAMDITLHHIRDPNPKPAHGAVPAQPSHPGGDPSDPRTTNAVASFMQVSIAISQLHDFVERVLLRNDTWLFPRTARLTRPRSFGEDMWKWDLHRMRSIAYGVKVANSGWYRPGKMELPPDDLAEEILQNVIPHTKSVDKVDKEVLVAERAYMAEMYVEDHFPAGWMFIWMEVFVAKSIVVAVRTTLGHLGDMERAGNQFALLRARSRGGRALNLSTTNWNRALSILVTVPDFSDAIRTWLKIQDLDNAMVKGMSREYSDRLAGEYARHVSNILGQKALILRTSSRNRLISGLSV